jgi:hypothetical protein
MRILSTNTDGQSELQAWGETVRLVGTCTEKRFWGESRIPRHSVSLTAGVSMTLNSHRCSLFPVKGRMINNFFVTGKTDKKFLSKNWQKLARRKMLISLEHLR